MKLPIPDLDDLIELAGQHAHIVLLQAKLKYLEPAWLIVLPTGNCSIVGTPWRSIDQKMVALESMRRHLKKVHATAYSLVSEIWTALAPKDLDLNRLDEVTPPSERADRREAVMAVAADFTSAKGKTWSIVRDESGQIIELKDQGPAHPNFVSRYVGLLRAEN